MPSQLDALPGGQIGKYLPAGLRNLFLDLMDFLFEADPKGMGFRMFLEFRQFILQFNDRLFKVELMFHRRQSLVFAGWAINGEFSRGEPRTDRGHPPTGMQTRDRISILYAKEPDLRPALRSDEV